MNKDTSATNRSIWSYALDLICGMATGFLSFIPFFSKKNFDKTLNREDRDAREFLPVLKDKFTRSWLLFLGLLIGSIGFFSVHIEYLFDGFKTACLCLMIGLILPNLIEEIYRFVKLKERRKNHLIACGSLFAGVFLLMILSYGFISYDPENFFSIPSYIFVFFLFFTGSYLMRFTGIGIGTVFFLFHYYIPYGKGIYELSLFHDVVSYLPLIILMIIASFGGYISALFTDSKLKDLRSEKGAINIALYLAGLIAVLAFELRPPFYSEITTDIAQLITICTALVGGLGIGFALTVPSYQKEKDTNETR